MQVARLSESSKSYAARAVSTTMNIYGGALMEAKREANSNAVKMVMQPKLVLVGVEPTPKVAANAS